MFICVCVSLCMGVRVGVRTCVCAFARLCVRVCERESVCASACVHMGSINKAWPFIRHRGKVRLESEESVKLSMEDFFPCVLSPTNVSPNLFHSKCVH